jgi:hypothetical protein
MLNFPRSVCPWYDCVFFDSVSWCTKIIKDFSICENSLSTIKKVGVSLLATENFEFPYKSSILTFFLINHSHSFLWLPLVFIHQSFQYTFKFDITNIYRKQQTNAFEKE